MDFYQINDLERLSGVKAHTIRIWEKRYGLIAPHRTETNIRYYDDEQLKKLLNVATLSNVGFKISKIAAFSENELKEQLLESQKIESTDIQYDFYINDFIGAMLDFDESKFEKLFDEIVEKYGFQDAVVKIVYPFLYKTGVLWSISETIPVQEHFASTLIKRKFYKLIADLPKFTKKEKKFLLFLPANEWHEIGLIFAEYIIRLHGYQTINLGQNVPFLDIEHVIKKTKPEFLMTFFTSNEHKQEMDQLLAILNTKHKNIICLLSGASAKIDSYYDEKKIKILIGPNDLLNIL